MGFAAGASRRGWRALLAVALVLAWAGGARAEVEPEVAFALGPIDVLGPADPMLAVAAGVFDFRRVGGKERYDGGPRAEGRVELYAGWKLFGFGPMVGLLANHDGGVYGWGGVYADGAWGPWRFTPVLGLGGYRRGQSKELGGVVEFYTGGSITYAFDGGTRLGLILSHLSNAYAHEENPGQESLLVTVMVPF
jgi:lipid A 3-O-deacylase